MLCRCNSNNKNNILFCWHDVSWISYSAGMMCPEYLILLAWCVLNILFCWHDVSWIPYSAGMMCPEYLILLAWCVLNILFCWHDVSWISYPAGMMCPEYLILLAWCVLNILFCWHDVSSSTLNSPEAMLAECACTHPPSLKQPLWSPENCTSKYLQP